MAYHNYYFARNSGKPTWDDVDDWLKANRRQHGYCDIINGAYFEQEQRSLEIMMTLEDPNLFAQRFGKLKTFFRNKRRSRYNMTKPNGSFIVSEAAKAAVEIVDVYLESSNPTARTSFEQCLLEEYWKDDFQPEHISSITEKALSKSSSQAPGNFEQYCSVDFWKSVFQSGHDISRWNQLSYDSFDISELPRELIIYLVFYHTFEWREKFYIFMRNKEYNIEQRKTLFCTVIEKTAALFHGSFYGSLWHMRSTPDTKLTQALDGDGKEVMIVDENNEPVKTITRKSISASVSGPCKLPDLSPDLLDRKIYEGVTEFTRQKGIDVNNNSWSLVRASFYTGEKEIRCYAFSGNAASDKACHELPMHWWKENKIKSEFWSENREIFICNVDRSQIFQKMILKIFDTLRPSIAKELSKLAYFISIDDLHTAEYIIGGQGLMIGPINTTKQPRFDLGTLDYGEFFDWVNEELSKSDDTIYKIASTILKGSEIDVKSIINFIRICKINPQYMPRKEKLEELELEPKRIKQLIKVCEEKLKELEEKISSIPEKFLDKVRKKIEMCFCGEDNVLNLLLEKYMANVDVYMLSPVKFISLDKNDVINGKPFCQVCNRKVRFFNLIPHFLSELGMTTNWRESMDILNELLN